MRTLIAGILASLICCGVLKAEAPHIPKLVVNGSAVLHKAADQMTMSIGVLTQAETAEAALSDNNTKMHAVVDGILQLGLEKGEYHTGQFSIQPIYSQPPKYPTQEWKPMIVAYEVNNTLNIKTEKLELTASIIDAAGKGGANQITNINFNIKDPQSYRTEAIALATANAMHDAQTIAGVANLYLVRILDVRLDQPNIYARPGRDMHIMMKAENAPFIEAPDVDISANISVTFEVATK